MAATPSGTAVDFFKRAGMRFHQFWLEAVALRPLPTLVTAEGDPLADHDIEPTTPPPERSG